MRDSHELVTLYPLCTTALHLFSSRQPRQTQWPSKTEEWSRSTQAVIGGVSPTNLRTQFNITPCVRGGLVFFLLNSRSCCCLKGMGHDEKAICRPSERCVGGEETYIPGQKLMFTVDSALCAFQTLIYAGYTLGPCFKNYCCFEKVT